ncbi:MAG: c-type cytochrome [Gammaproteobacteria bacterium]
MVRVSKFIVQVLVGWQAFLLLVLSPPLAIADGGKQAAALYRQHCAACHGDQGDGKSRAQFGLNPPPRNFTTADSWYELSRERMLTSVKYGRPGTAMVGWSKRLSDEDIAGVVDYIRGHFMREPEDTDVQLGKRLYKQHCSACHGDRGDGASWAKNSLNPPPRDFTAAPSRAELSRERMITSVTHGRPGSAMMPFASRLSAHEIEAVVGYIRSQFMGFGGGQTVQPATGGEAAPLSLVEAPVRPYTPAPADMRAPFPHGLQGDAGRGRRFYEANCFTCHGRQGDGRGPRADFIRPPPRNFLAAQARRYLNRPALFQAIARGKTGTVMPAWATVLDNQQIADVAEYVFQAFIRPPGGLGTAGGEQKKKAPRN